LGYRAVGQSGSAGGESGIITNSRTYITQGGNGGGAGQFSTSSTTDVSRPNGGTIGGYSVPDATTTQDGNAGSMPIFIKSNGNITQAFGGMGGKSPTGTFGGCGGLYVYSQDPNGTADENSDPRCNNQETAGLKSDIIMPTNLHNTQDFGSAGAGGGGGGWDFDHAREQGSGGAGQPGYVYIYWAKVD